MFKLLYPSPQEWVDYVLQHFERFLVDHAAAEKKAAGMAMSMVSHYPDKPDLVKAMIELAIEEMHHFREVVKRLHERGLILEADSKDTYVNALRKLQRKGRELYFLDRLLLGAIIEARGCERFGLIAEALPKGELKDFYCAIAESESRHENLFIELASRYFDAAQIQPRLNELLQHEAEICRQLPIQAALH